jgi:multiple sugar transport system substrate-binding protein
MRRRSTRLIGAAASFIAGSLLLAACGGPAAPEEGHPLELSKEPVTLRFTWWGNDARTAATEKVIAMFEEEYPNITIDAQFTDWAGYWDKLATETAANDSPDIIQMDEKYIATYGERGGLLDLANLGDAIETDDFAESALDTGYVGDALYGIPVGLNSYSYIVNPTIFETAGIDLPDPETWTWDDYKDVAIEISEVGGGDYYGTVPFGFEDGGLRNWARQYGEDLYSEDGDVAISEDVLSGWYAYILDLVKESAAPASSAIVEKQVGGLAESFTATNAVGIQPWWNSQLTALADASGSPLQIFRVPTRNGKADGSAYYKSSMYWSISARSEHPAEAALFVNWLANNEEAAEVLLTERGVPANEKIRAHIEPLLSDNDKAVVAYLDELADVVGEAPPITPAGGSAIEALLKQYTEQVLFEKLTPEEAAKAFIKDLQAAIDAA